jgi:NAD(P)-dependent dehydrogenase (short-subunit alcohol dehydrogenase family)
MAHGLARSGIAVGLFGRSGPALDEVAGEIRESGGRALIATADVRDFASVEAAVGVIHEGLVEAGLGGIDLLVNNAGVIDPVEVPVWEADPQDWWDVVETDLRGPFHLVRATVPGMLARGGGRVIDLSSGAGAKDREIYSAYCAAKAGLFRVSGNLHLAGFDRGLRAFEISPGTVRSDMTASMPMHADRTDWTPPEALVELVLGVARGELDAWSGGFLRAGLDTVAGLRQAEADLVDIPGGAVPSPLRRLGVLPWGQADPVT